MSVPALCAEPPFLCYFIFTTASHFLGTVILSLSCQSAWKNDHILVILSRSPFLQAGSCQHCFPGSLQESLNQHIQWYPRSLRLIQQLGCQLQISLQTFLFIVPGTVSSLIFFSIFLFSFHFIYFFIYCMHACTHIPWHNKMLRGVISLPWPCMWLLGIELRLTGMVTSAFTDRAILPFSEICFQL